MTNHDFDIDLFWLSPEPKNWFETIKVSLSDAEADILANAIIDQKFILPPRPNASEEGDDYLIIERAPSVHARILQQMEAEADSHGWTDCVSQFKNANICFGESLWELAKSLPRWKELSDNGDNLQATLRKYVLIDRDNIVAASKSHNWPIIAHTQALGAAWSGMIEDNKEAWISAFLQWKGTHLIDYSKSCIAQRNQGQITLHNMPMISFHLTDIIEKWNATCIDNGGNIEIRYTPKNDGTDSQLLIDIVDRVLLC